MSKNPNARYYDQGGIETIEFIRAKLTREQFIGYCLGNALKYLSRANFKNTSLLEDTKKAGDYVSWLEDEKCPEEPSPAFIQPPAMSPEAQLKLNDMRDYSECLEQTNARMSQELRDSRTSQKVALAENQRLREQVTKLKDARDVSGWVPKLRVHRVICEGVPYEVDNVFETGQGLVIHVSSPKIGDEKAQLALRMEQEVS